MWNPIYSPWTTVQPYMYMQRYINDGHEIGAHSLSHPALSAYTSPNTNQSISGNLFYGNTNLANVNRVVAEVVYSKNFLQQYLQTYLSQPAGTVKHFATPFGDYNTSVLNTIMGTGTNQAGHASHRTVDIGYNSKDNLDVKKLKCLSIEYGLGREDQFINHTTKAEFEQWVDKAKSENLWLIIMYHRVVDMTNLWPAGVTYEQEHLYFDKQQEIGQPDATLDMFKHNMQYIKDSGITVKTMSDALLEVLSQ